MSQFRVGQRVYHTSEKPYLEDPSSMSSRYVDLEKEGLWPYKITAISAAGYLYFWGFHYWNLPDSYRHLYEYEDGHWI